MQCAPGPLHMQSTSRSAMHRGSRCGYILPTSKGPGRPWTHAVMHLLCCRPCVLARWTARRRTPSTCPPRLWSRKSAIRRAGTTASRDAMSPGEWCRRGTAMPRRLLCYAMLSCCAFTPPYLRHSPVRSCLLACPCAGALTGMGISAAPKARHQPNLGRPCGRLNPGVPNPGWHAKPCSQD